MNHVVNNEAVDITEIRHQGELAAALTTLRLRSRYSFKALAAAIDRPTTTVHGWFSGRHLPYQRDNDDERHGPYRPDVLLDHVHFKATSSVSVSYPVNRSIISRSQRDGRSTSVR